MNMTLRCARAEAFKLSRRKKYWVFLALLLASGAAFALTGAGSVVSISGARLLTGALQTVYLPLIAFLATCDLFAGEIRQKSIRACLARPVSRAAIFMGKCLAALGVCALHALCYALVSGACAACAGGSARAALDLALGALIDLAPLLCLVCFSALINLVCPAPGLCMLLCIALYAALKTLGALCGFSQALFTGYMRWHDLFLYGGMPARALLPRILAVLGETALFGCAGALIFEQKRY